MVIQEKSWEKWKNEIQVSHGYAVIMCTDCFEVMEYPQEETEIFLAENWKERLLDVRIFDSKKEYRMFRGDVGKPFSETILDDRLGDYFDDEQYLDIDAKRSANIFTENKKVKATGGGSYSLPLTDFENVKLIIRNYLGYDERGHAYVKAIRLIDFEKDDFNRGGK